MKSFADTMPKYTRKIYEEVLVAPVVKRLKEEFKEEIKEEKLRLRQERQEKLRLTQEYGEKLKQVEAERENKSVPNFTTISPISQRVIQNSSIEQ